MRCNLFQEGFKIKRINIIQKVTDCIRMAYETDLPKSIVLIKP